MMSDSATLLAPAPDVPRVHRSSLWGPRGPKVVGLGGNRGAVVTAVGSPDLPRRAHKDYLYPRTVPRNERAFIAAALEARRRSTVFQAFLAANEGDTENAQYDFTLYSHLVIPEAIVDESGLDRGVLMPMLSCNLYDFLTETRTPQDQLSENPTLAVFHHIKRFEPIRDPVVIAAIVFQLVHGVAMLNTEVPHNNGRSCGFSHNDLHLANVLLHYDTGSVVLCDFELVQPISLGASSSEGGGATVCQEMMERTPPLHRHPPHGLGTPTSDTWGIGLVTVDMLTGVAPLINEDIARDDFGDGPLLVPRAESGGIPVIDWSDNIGVHVQHVRGVFDGDCTVTDLLYDFCKVCLTNADDATDGPRVADLKDHALFTIFESSSACGLAGGRPTSCSLGLHSLGPEHDALLRAHEVVRRFAESGGERRPADRSRMLQRSGSSVSTIGESSFAPT